MNMKVHYLVTFGVLLIFGIFIAKPRTNPNGVSEQRSCKMIKGKMDCFNKFVDYRINTNMEVQYKLN